MNVAERIKGKLAGFQAGLFRDLIVKEKLSAKLVSTAFSFVSYECLFESVLIEGKIHGRFPSGLLPAEAIRDVKVHVPIAEEIARMVSVRLEESFPRFLWTSWISSRNKPL